VRFVSQDRFTVEAICDATNSCVRARLTTSPPQGPARSR
jgi:hypothetical protein